MGMGCNFLKKIFEGGILFGNVLHLVLPLNVSIFVDPDGEPDYHQN